MPRRNIYQIKQEFLPLLSNLPGFEISRNNSQSFTFNLRVIEQHPFNHSTSTRFLNVLPRSSDKRLIYSLLDKLEQNYLSYDAVRRLRKYLQLSKKEDEQNEMRANLKLAIKEIAFGLFLISGGVAGFVMILSLITLIPAVLLVISLALSLFSSVFGIIKLFKGFYGLANGFCSVCFRAHPIHDLARLKNSLERINEQARYPLPSYQDAVGNPVSANQFFTQHAPPPYEEVAPLASAPTERSSLVANTAECLHYATLANSAMTTTTPTQFNSPRP